VVVAGTRHAADGKNVIMLVLLTFALLLLLIALLHMPLSLFYRWNLLSRSLSSINSSSYPCSLAFTASPPEASVHMLAGTHLARIMSLTL
jgi:hypothetical protein